MFFRLYSLYLPFVGKHFLISHYMPYWLPWLLWNNIHIRKQYMVFSVFISTSSNMASSMSNNRLIYESWRDIQEIIGDAHKWPAIVRKLFWTQGVKHFDRLILATFVLVNGMNPEQFMDWARLMRLGRDEAAYRHFEYLFRTLPDQNNKSLYAYNVTTNRYEYINGEPRYYVHASMRKWVSTCNILFHVLLNQITLYVCYSKNKVHTF